MAKICLLIFALLVCRQVSASEDQVAVQFVNQKTIDVTIFESIGTDPKKVAVLKSTETYQITSSLGRRFTVDFADGNQAWFEITESSLQKITLGQTHSVFPLLGWRIHLNDQLWHSPELTKVWFDLMVGQLTGIRGYIPKEALAELQKVPIWVNPPYENIRPTAEYHPSAGWLKQNSRDTKMAKSVEITNMENFAFEIVRMPNLMLHELSHAYHDRVLSFRHPGIRQCFEAAKNSGKYDKVDRFTGRRIVKDKAYAMSNENEYFAENSEAFFGRNDFYPFNRKELFEHDKPMHDLLAKLWGVEIDSN